MSKKEWQDLGSTVSALAADSVLTQQRLDAAVAEARERFVALLATVPEEARSLLLPLAPAGIHAKEYRISCSLRVTTRRSASFSLVAAPVNIGYRTLYGSTTAETSSLCVEVQAVPGVLFPTSKN